MSDSKNAYELRTDLLGMAIGILESRNSRIAENEHFLAENDSGYHRQPVAPYATEDVVVVADKLYEFVQNKGS